MKKTILMISVAIFMVSNLFAQTSSDNFRTKISIGAKIGANLSNVYDSQGEQFNADAKFGLATGLFVAIPFGKYLGIQPELLFSQKGYQGSGSIFGSNYSFSYTTNFIDVPILLAFKPLPFITVLAGPQYSFLISDKYVFNSAIVNTIQENEFNNDNIRKNILSMLAGFDLNFKNVVVGARVGWDLQDNKGDGTSETPQYKNVWYQATIGFRL
jgi:hypothetical protein